MTSCCRFENCWLKALQNKSFSLRSSYSFSFYVSLQSPLWVEWRVFVKDYYDLDESLKQPLHFSSFENEEDGKVNNVFPHSEWTWTASKEICEHHRAPLHTSSNYLAICNFIGHASLLRLSISAKQTPLTDDRDGRDDDCMWRRQRWKPQFSWVEKWLSRRATIIMIAGDGNWYTWLASINLKLINSRSQNEILNLVFIFSWHRAHGWRHPSICFAILSNVISQNKTNTLQ